MSYDAASRVLTYNNANSSITYSYNAANELISETQGVTGSGAARTLTYSYDADGNRASLTYPDGTVLDYTYTGRNQLKEIEESGNTVVSYAYDSGGLRLQKALGNGTDAFYAYDMEGRLSSLEHQAASTPFARFDFGYDVADRRVYEQRDNALGDVYQYDSGEQIIGVKYNAVDPDSSPSGELKREAFTYDSAGNREMFTVATSTATNTTAYSVNALNQYSAVGAGAPVYDVNGNLLTITGSGETNVYDAQSRLISASSGGVTTTFAYDAQNRCVKRAVTGGITLYYTYDGWSLIEERSGFGSQVAEYVHGATIDEILKKTSPSGTVYYHHNALGSTTALTDNSGAVVERYQYDLFGSVTIADGSGTPRSNTAYGNRFLYTGREWLGGSVASGGFGLSIYDYRNRIYSPTLGRFLQTDPIRFAAGDDNIYRYVGNRPVQWIDTFGLKLSFPDWILDLFCGLKRMKDAADKAFEAGDKRRKEQEDMANDPQGEATKNMNNPVEPGQISPEDFQEIRDGINDAVDNIPGTGLNPAPFVPKFDPETPHNSPPSNTPPTAYPSPKIDIPNPNPLE